MENPFSKDIGWDDTPDTLGFVEFYEAAKRPKQFNG